VLAAQRATISKARIEVSDLRRIARELTIDTPAEDQFEMWSSAGQLLYGTRGSTPPAPVLDAASRGLVVRLHTSGLRDMVATEAETAAMIAQLERTIVADTALNQLRLRPQIAREIVRRGGRVEFTSLNAWIYDQVFRTPREDPWLGLLPRDVFTGVPGDGVAPRNAIRRPGVRP
jgi:hypothetical protein